MRRRPMSVERGLVDLNSTVPALGKDVMKKTARELPLGSVGSWLAAPFHGVQGNRWSGCDSLPAKVCFRRRRLLHAIGQMQPWPTTAMSPIAFSVLLVVPLRSAALSESFAEE